MKTQSEYEKEVGEIHKNSIIVVGEYLGSNKKVKLKCKECNNIWETKPSHTLAGSGCPSCKTISKGEDKIRDLLNNYKINFEEEYRYDDCRNIKPLPFDFAILGDNGSISNLIEFDGKQHFAPFGFGSKNKKEAKENFILRQKLDEIKNKYCKDNGIPLLRIPYWNFDNIEEILWKNYLI